VILADVLVVAVYAVPAATLVALLRLDPRSLAARARPAAG
jgi:hypothetical protein